MNHETYSTSDGSDCIGPVTDAPTLFYRHDRVRISLSLKRPTSDIANRYDVLPHALEKLKAAGKIRPLMQGGVRLTDAAL